MKKTILVILMMLIIIPLITSNLTEAERIKSNKEIDEQFSIVRNQEVNDTNITSTESITIKQIELTTIEFFGIFYVIFAILFIWLFKPSEKEENFWKQKELGR